MGERTHARMRDFSDGWIFGLVDKCAKDVWINEWKTVRMSDRMSARTNVRTQKGDKRREIMSLMMGWMLMVDRLAIRIKRVYTNSALSPWPPGNAFSAPEALFRAYASPKLRTAPRRPAQIIWLDKANALADIWLPMKGIYEKRRKNV